ncbi:hypothetical protein PHET_08823 [Paragonimus heterotremus]|uniref:Uncharacterized protein n=1 Tax=Paragonimus heterotremus TaxID=100268 RepID=A0A8J4WUM0_9TREM|nr:hypothetical protein PHET_08823 [Paragonimus heterotremus]
MSEIDPVGGSLRREQEALGDLGQELRVNSRTTWNDDPFAANSRVTDEPWNVNLRIMLNGDDAVHSSPVVYSASIHVPWAYSAKQHFEWNSLF